LARLLIYGQYLISMESKIFDLIEDPINKFGFSLVKVTIHGDIRKIVEVLIEKLDGNRVSVEDCSFVSRNISAILDVEDAISGKYFLEVSSAGVERPLVKLEDFVKFTNREVKIRLKTASNGKSTYKGKLLRVDGENIILCSGDDEISLDLGNIRRANLVFTEEEFRSLLNKK